MVPSELVEYLERRAGTSLRGTVAYDGNGTNVLYLRDDLQEVRLQSDVDRMLQRVRPESMSAEERAFPFGDLHATVRVFDETVFMHFPTGNDRGVVVSMEAEAAHDLNTFVGECLERIRG